MLRRRIVLGLWAVVAALAVDSCLSIDRWGWFTRQLISSRSQPQPGERRPEREAALSTNRATGAEAFQDGEVILINRPPREGHAPLFDVVDLAGDHIKLDDMLGRVVLLDFWGTWCPPCVVAVPSLVELNRKYARKGMVTLGISSDAGSDRDVVSRFIVSHSMAWPEYIDEDHRLERAYQVRVFPTCVVISPDGIIRDRIEGWGVDSRDQLDQAIERALMASRKRD